MSAEGGTPTEVVADAVLLAGFGSASLPLAVALLWRVRAGVGRVAWLERAGEARLSRVPLHDALPTAEFVHPVLAETKVTPAGRVSVTTTPVAGDGPLLVAVTV